jgi:hypothetical protein
MNLKYPIYNPFGSEHSAIDWGFAPPWEPEQTEVSRDLETVLACKYKIASVPVFCNEPHRPGYNALTESVDFGQFDLVLLSDIEYYSQSEIRTWAEKTGIKRFLLAAGGKHTAESTDNDTVIYRPWWTFNLLNFNQYQDTSGTNKPLLFDALLGARRFNRDFAMLSLQKLNLLDRSIVTYRDIFQGHQPNHQYSNQMNQRFSGLTVPWPYVSNNLDPAWEVDAKLTYSISPLVPWKIYQQTWYSIVCETIGMGDTFFLSEKTTKPLFAKRLFLVYSSVNFLQKLKNLGFQTFSSVIDESYDSIVDPFERYSAIETQLDILSRENPQHIYEKINPVLEHNHRVITNMQSQIHRSMRQMIFNAIQSPQ